MLGLLAGSAQDEREARRKGFEQARSRSIKNGVYNGRAPFGYRKRDDGRLETDKPEAKIVLKVFEQREQERHLVDDHERLDRSTRLDVQDADHGPKVFDETSRRRPGY